MPVFEYRGNRRDGTAVHGTVQAANKPAALAELRGQDIWLTDLQDMAARPAAVAGRQWSLAHALWPLSKGQASLFFRQLAALMRAGVGANAALRAVEDRIGSSRLRRMIRDMADETGRGDGFAAVFDRRGYVFGPFVPQMMTVGERTGRLDVVCDQIAEQYELEHRMWRSLALQKAYLWVLVCFGICLPGLPGRIIQEEGIFEGIAVYGDYFVHVLLPIILGLIFGAKLLRIALSTPRLRPINDWLALRYPLTGPIVRQAALMRFLRTMSAMLEAGVPVADCVEAAAGATANAALASPILRNAPGLREGVAAAHVLHSAGVFSRTAMGMIATGEESGTLPESLRYLAEEYHSESDGRLSSLKWVSYLGALLFGSIIVVIAGGLALTSYYDRIFGIFEDLMP
jgi:type II secretory pathway component PulF